MGRPSRLDLVDDASRSVPGVAAKHVCLTAVTPPVVAARRQLRLVPQPCHIEASTTVNEEKAGYRPGHQFGRP